jgi:DNA topoisomerase-1
MTVVVVESPAKAKTINKYLGKDYKVIASYGHIRDLPSKDGSVRPDEDFALDWEMDAKGSKHLKEIADALKEHDKLILATDPDREGEAISWHVLEALNKRRALKDKAVSRVTFNAITKDSVLKAMAAPRDINMELVDAYLARRALDYLVGFTLSPVLWRKLPGARSAGRVQSVALRLICDREMEIEAFKPQEYWTVEASLCAKADMLQARLSAFEGKKIQRLDIGDGATAQRAVTAIKAGKFVVAAVEAKPVRRNPPPPFTTSTLQQEAARKLGFSATRTMQAAQRLYEGVDIGGDTVGLITYMRTDGVDIAEEGLAALRGAVNRNFGAKYLPDAPRRYTTKAKNAQEAHEAIRPTDPSRHPDSLKIEGDLKRLYDLIWKRAMASQMEGAMIERTTIDFKDQKSPTELRATGQVILFDGFLTLYQEGRDDEEDEDSRRLPKLEVGQAVDVIDAKADQHFTEPPPRYSEASLVKKLEELGIGRPSTYAATLEKLRERDYVRMDRNRFIPEDKGRLVTAFLENFFHRYVEYDFTAALEEKLDDISAGALPWKQFLRDFWRQFSGDVGEIGDLRVAQVLDALNETLGPHIFPAREDGADPRTCPSCGAGQLSLKVGRYGAFIGCSNYPECKFTRTLAPADENEETIPAEGKPLGDDPQTGAAVVLKVGRFGPYVEVANGEKPKRSSLPRGWAAEDMGLERALKLLSLPREVGPHPEDQEMILAGLGRYGPYIQKGKTYVNLPGIDDALEIGLNRAVALFEEKKNGGGRRGRAAQPPLKELGESPVTGKPVRVLEGRYGQYVTDGVTNATLPKGTDPLAVTADQALALLAARAELGPTKKQKAKMEKAAKAKAEKEAAKAAKDADKPAKAKPAKKPAASKAAKKPVIKKK